MRRIGTVLACVMAAGFFAVSGVSAAEDTNVTLTLDVNGGASLPAGVSLSAVKAKVGDEEVAFTDLDSDGVFEAEFHLLLPGLYPVTLVPPSGVILVTNPKLPLELELEAGKNVVRSITITSATMTVP